MKNIELMNASAGSGKTFNLTARVVDAMRNGVAPESVMATTFTKRAAAELRERIRLQLMKSNQPEEANRINDGFIGTVNGVCGRLLKEYAIEAGLSPAVQIMPDEDSASIFNISIDRVIEKYAVQMEPAARRLELIGGGSGYQSNEDWRGTVRKIVDFARSNQMDPIHMKQFAQDSWASLEAVLGKTVELNLDAVLKDAMREALSKLSTMDMQTKKSESAYALLSECAARFETNQLPWSDWCRLSKLDPGKAELEVFDPVITIADKVLKNPHLHADLKQIIVGSFNCAIEALGDYDLYKREHGLMDFVDQEAKVLKIAQHNQAFRDSINDRIQMLMVDEFQDTSPIELALFLAMNELAGTSVWVGDPKQAIYAFRGTDPQLMEEVVARVNKSKVLDESWRSKENLINFSNALFSEAFYKMGAEKVCLKVPELRKEKAKGGTLETWHLTGSKKEEAYAAVANGVRDLLERQGEIKPGDIAVLCRTNMGCAKIAAGLEKLGVRASAGQGLLLQTKECRLALAALRYMNNQNDKLALAEMMQGFGAQSPGYDWLSELMKDPKQTKDTWETNPLIVELNLGRCNMKYWTPLEALEEAISRTLLLRKVKAWSNPRLAVSNLDALRQACKEYMDLCTARRSAVTVDGFITYIREAEKEQAKGTDEGAVNVMTYHAAKGLEWPWVVLTDLDAPPKSSVFGATVEAATNFDISNPLANRSIRYWPWPFGSQGKLACLDDKIQQLPLTEEAHNKAIWEAQRLLYVGITRAKDGLILAIRKAENKSGESLKTDWLDALTNAKGEVIIDWPIGEGKQTLQVGGTKIPVTNIVYGPDEAALPPLTIEQDEFLSILPDTSTIYPAGRVSPSGLGEETNDLAGSTWEILHQFDHQMSIAGKPEMNMVGNAVHGFFGADSLQLAEEDRLILAQENLMNWGVENAIDAAELAATGQQLLEYIETKYLGCIIHKEWPMSLHDCSGQHMQGWIDMLLELPEGFILLDHKDHNEHSNEEGKPIEESMKQYLRQMSAYIKTIEKATGKPVLETILHLPVQGMLVRLKK